MNIFINSIEILILLLILLSPVIGMLLILFACVKLDKDNSDEKKDKYHCGYSSLETQIKEHNKNYLANPTVTNFFRPKNFFNFRGR